MLQGVATVRKEEEEERKKGNEILKSIEKRKSSIETYFHKETKDD